jgi:hypothetical protein
MTELRARGRLAAEIDLVADDDGEQRHTERRG